MLKNLFLLSTILTLSIPLVSQTDVQWTTSSSIQTPLANKHLLEQDKKTGSVFVLRVPHYSNSTSTDMFLEEYNISNGLAKKTVIEQTSGILSNSITFEKHLEGENELLLFYKHWQKETKSITYKVRTCSFDGEISKEDVTLTSFTAKNIFKQGYQHFAISPDKSKYAILVDPLFEKKTQDQYQVIIFDANSHKRLGDHAVTTSVIAKSAQSKLLLSNDGSVYIYRQYVIAGLKYQYGITSINGSDGKIVNTVLNRTDKNQELRSHELFFNKDEVVLAGYYSLKIKDHISGVFASKLKSSTGSFSQPEFLPFGPRVGEFKKVRNLELKDIILLSDGRFQVLGEVTSIEFNSKGETLETKQYDHTLGDIVFTCLKPDLSVDWELAISKSQKTTTVGNQKMPWTSFSFGVVDDKVYIVYNNLNTPHDWLDPLGKKVYHNRFKGGHYKPFLYVIEKNGNVKYADRRYGLPLFTFHDSYSNLYSNPQLSLTRDNKWFFFAGRNDGSDMKLGLWTIIEE